MVVIDACTCTNIHPAGNKKSLVEIPKAQGINVREELLKFHDKYYSANLMNLVVLSKGNSVGAA